MAIDNGESGSSVRTELNASLALTQAITASAAELNILDGATLTVTELNYVDGVTSAIQTQLDSKIDGSGTAANVPFFTDTNTLAGDNHFTYDSINDVLHVHKLAGDATDGLLLESENGTDVGVLGMANTANATWYGSHNYNAATADRIAHFNSSKTLTGLDTATYPNLAELAYVKGVTGAIQTQLNAKEPTKGSDDNYVTDAQLVVIANTSGTNTGDQTISDATISTTDITTNNASTTKHGFLKKLSNVATEFINGVGDWVNIATATLTLTNKRITKRTGTTTSSATPTINTDDVDYYELSALAVDITSFTTNLSGTPTLNQLLWISIVGTATRAITWGASFSNGAVTLPTSVTTTRLDIGLSWNGTTWQSMAKTY